MEKKVLLVACLSVLFLSCGDKTSAPAPYGATPSKAQLQWHDVDFYGMICISTITYTDKEWGYGDEPAELFNPNQFNADEAVAIMKEAGMKGVLLVAKHHGGFCLWPTSTTEYSVKNSPWKDGKGDMVREYADAARKAGLKFGVYCSPWDRNDADYGKPEYLQHYREQLRELHTRYGDIFLSWYDGANGGDGYYGGAKETRKLDLENYYDWDHTFKTVREWQPLAAIFNGPGADIRWVGNERGFASDPCWATFDPAAEGSARWHLGTGQRNGRCWMPAECDVPIRPGWFYHESQNGQVKTPEQLFDLYFLSVGRGQALDIGLAPDRSGKLHLNDVKSLRGLGDLLRQTFTNNFAQTAVVTVNQTWGESKKFSGKHLTDNDKQTYWCPNDETAGGEITLEWKEPQKFNIVSLREYLPLGQRIDSISAEIFIKGQWQAFAKATSIGANRLLRHEPVEASKLRIHTYGPVAPALSEIGVYRESERTLAPVKPDKVRDPEQLAKTAWTLIPANSDKRAFDDDISTVWQATDGRELSIDLGDETAVSAVVYTPPVSDAGGLITHYRLYISNDPKQWGQAIASGEFSNIRNNPQPYTIRLEKPVKGRYIRLVAADTVDDAPPAVAEIEVLILK
ncbi:MAG: alpha-L-fucosidase [Tannerella sp.]|jgi:alpha-L-fucosidase|nr:alpha-L-fucosidase [Tannerella sp.]